MIALTPGMLRAATGCTQDAADIYAAPLFQAAAYYSINTPARLAAFLAQLGHESGSLRYTREIWGPTFAQAGYEGRRDLGNIYAGDGAKYRGHGLIQVTGRSNHAAARDRLRVEFGTDVPDFEFDPEALMQPRWACLSAADWWAHHGCNELADAGNYIGIGRLINRGSATATMPANGEADRLLRWEKARAAIESSQSITEPVNTEPAPADTTPITSTQSPAPVAPKENTIMGSTLLWGLAQSLIGIFAPLAKEKITKEVSRHTTNPEVADQVANTIIDSAIRITGKTDPIDAVSAAKADPVIVQQIEADALMTLERLAPVLDKMAAWDRDAWESSEKSMSSAASRAADLRGDRPFLRFGEWFAASFIEFLSLLLLFISAGGALTLALNDKLDNQLLGAIVTLMLIAGYTGVREFWLGTSRSSSAKDVVIGELSRRPAPANPPTNPPTNPPA